LLFVCWECRCVWLVVRPSKPPSPRCDRPSSRSRGSKGQRACQPRARLEAHGKCPSSQDLMVSAKPRRLRPASTTATRRWRLAEKRTEASNVTAGVAVPPAVSRLASLALLARDAVPLGQAIERASVDSQELGGQFLVPARLPEDAT